MLRYYSRYYLLPVFLVGIFTSSCKKFLEVGPPKTDLTKTTVFEGDGTAKAAMASLYAQLVSSYASGTAGSVTYLAGLSSDELQNYNPSADFVAFSNNNLTALNSNMGRLWSSPYESIFQANSILEGLSQSSGVTPSLNLQLQGEAKFIRAFAHFYLVNLFGDVPLALTTDYRINASMPRTSTSLVYRQIIDDLKDAKDKLPADYSISKNERTRVNKFAASALLARVYLYIGNWQDAEAEASAVINKTDLYTLSSPGDVFLKNSGEAIWQLIRDAGNANDALTFLIPPTAVVPPNSALPANWVHSFDPSDKRKAAWIASLVSTSGTYFYPTKYKNTALSPITEYTMVMRLAEQYLVRAEARLMQGKIVGQNSAASDLNALRMRAGISETTATDKAGMLNAIEQERRFELFTEWGHRWFDLKRWPGINNPGDVTIKRADEVLQPLKPGWRKEWKLYPIPQNQILNDPAMANQQNPGYN